MPLVAAPTFSCTYSSDLSAPRQSYSLCTFAFAQYSRVPSRIARRQWTVWPRGADGTNIRLLISTVECRRHSIQHTAYSIQHTTCNIHHATCAAAVAALRRAVAVGRGASHAVWAAAREQRCDRLVAEPVGAQVAMLERAILTESLTSATYHAACQPTQSACASDGRLHARPTAAAPRHAAPLLRLA
jgi:hypothetical protein